MRRAPSRTTLAALALAAASALLAAAPVSGAVLARLVPAEAAAGDTVEVRTAPPGLYAGLASGGPVPVFLQPTSDADGNRCGSPVGTMTWSGGDGSATFRVPDVAAGTYWVLAQVEGACWRFGDADSSGPLVLTVVPARGLTPPALTALAVFGLILAASILWARRRRRHRKMLR